MSARLVLQALREANLPSEKIFLAVSGGLDSSVLMHAVAKILLPATVLHVNHKLRGKESDLDESFSRAEAEKLGFNFCSVQLDWHIEKASQNSCRQKRERFFQEQVGDGVLLFAHHRDDQAETVFQRILRGTGIDGLGGIKFKSGYKIRPFLSLTKEDLRLAALEWGIQWREDSSNSTSKYERNWLRNEILPILEKRKPGFKKRLCDLAQEAQQKRESNKTFHGFEFNNKKFYFVEGASPVDLKRNFSLSRAHANALNRLVKVGSGKLSAKEKFWVSNGLLMVQQDFSFIKNSVSKQGKSISFKSELGSWCLPSSEAGIIGSRTKFSLGDSGKKMQQKKRIPVFFREAIPFFCVDKKVVLLTPEESKSVGVDFTPTDLGEWFFTALQKRDDRAD